MAVRKGRNQAFGTARGIVLPRMRVVSTVGKPVVFEMPAATSRVISTARTLDAAAVVVRNLECTADSRLAVTGVLDKLSDAQVLVVRSVSVDSDLTTQVNHELDLRPDVSVAVFKRLERTSDSRAVIVHPQSLVPDAKMVIYEYLLRESHVIGV